MHLLSALVSLYGGHPQRKQKNENKTVKTLTTPMTMIIAGTFE